MRHINFHNYLEHKCTIFQIKDRDCQTEQNVKIQQKVIQQRSNLTSESRIG